MSDQNLEVEMRGDTPYVKGVAMAAYTLNSTQMLVGSSADVPTARTLSGDVTVGNTGVTAIGASKVLETMINNEAVTPAKTSGVAVLYNLGAPVVADVDRVVVSADMKVGDFTIAEQPDIPRNITVTHAAVGTVDTLGTITIVGTNYADEVIEEEITPVDGTTVAGTKAFKTVTTVTGAGWEVDAVEETADTIEVGVGDELGCHVTADATTDIMLAILGVTITAHNPTVSNPATLEGSTVDLSAGTYDGSKEVIVFQKN